MNKKGIFLLYFSLLLFTIVNLFISVNAKNKLTSYERQITIAVKRAKKSVVRITTYKSRHSHHEGLGSGVIFDKRGYILTNYHVIKSAQNIVVTLYDGRKAHAYVVNATSKYDLAVLKIDLSSLNVATFGNSDKLKLGQTVLTIGNPLKFGWTVTSGVVSALHRRVVAGGLIYENLIQTDAPINKGNSGGALINSSGEVIGINTLVYEGTRSTYAQGIGFAIPSNTALYIGKKLMSKKGIKYSIDKPWLGIGMMEITPDSAYQWGLAVSHGILITDIVQNGPSDKAGLKEGDIITKIDGVTVLTVKQLKFELTKKRVGQLIVLEVWRGKRKMNISVRLERKSQ